MNTPLVSGVVRYGTLHAQSGQKWAAMRRRQGELQARVEIDYSRQCAQTAKMVRYVVLFVVAMLVFGVPLEAETQRSETRLSVPERDGNIPRTRWEHVPGSVLWTRSALSALKQHGTPLAAMVPEDIADWCPAYPRAAADQRRAFWVGFLSALAKHESTYRAQAVGGGGRWFGLLQILPATARGYGCRAGSGDALQHGPDNLSCAIRIMAHTVPRDGVVSRGKRGVAADWGPLHSPEKRGDMMRWTRSQSYCKPLNSLRPRARPATVASIATQE